MGCDDDLVVGGMDPGLDGQIEAELRRAGIADAAIGAIYLPVRSIEVRDLGGAV
jgi:hypothetical protein